MDGGKILKLKSRDWFGQWFRGFPGIDSGRGTFFAGKLLTNDFVYSFSNPVTVSICKNFLQGERNGSGA